jgi:hypothetical protein
MDVAEALFKGRTVGRNGRQTKSPASYYCFNVGHYIERNAQLTAERLCLYRL